LSVEPVKNEFSTAEIFNIRNSKPVHLMDFIAGLEDEIGKKEFYANAR